MSQTSSFVTFSLSNMEEISAGPWSVANVCSLSVVHAVKLLHSSSQISNHAVKYTKYRK